MEWSGQKAFGTSPTVKFVVDGAEAGSLNSYGPLSFLKVCGQGCIFDCDSVALLIYHLVTLFIFNMIILLTFTIIVLILSLVGISD